MTRSIRIGNVQAFWGDRSDAAAEMLAGVPDLDYLTLDYLAEVSMSILARQRERDPDAGYARDFVDVVRSLVPYWAAGGSCRLITNAGGLNSRGCAEACRVAIEASGCRSLRIGVIAGDDVLPVFQSESATSEQFRNLDAGTDISEVRHRLVTANAYLGAASIVKSLADRVELLITGRVADPSLTVAACMHHFGWTDEDHDKLAGATVAGHLIECGTQVTGGISTDWLDVPDVGHIGFPIVEVFDDGSSIITKPPGTGGCVTPRTVKEQLLYEIGDPDNYLSPDVTASFCELQVDDLGDDRVRVAGAKGRPPPPTYKVSATYRDGYRAAGTLTIFGRDAEAKARRCGELVLQRLRDSGFELRDTLVECLGSGDCVPGIFNVCSSGQPGPPPQDAIETVLRVAAEADSFEAVERFTRELMPFITAGPQGTTGYAEGRPRVQPVFRYWPCLIDRDAVTPHVEMLITAPPITGNRSRGSSHTASSLASSREVGYVSANQSDQSTSDETQPSSVYASNEHPTTLYDLAYARSGDKGANANIGVIARRPKCWEFLKNWLTADRVAEFFGPLGVESVERFELPNLCALNFLLRGILHCGLRTDAQGKTLGVALLEMPLPQDLRMIPKEGIRVEGAPHVRAGPT